jgi:hypothetical protein
VYVHIAEKQPNNKMEGYTDSHKDESKKYIE